MQVAAQTVSGLALGTLIYLATGSALLSALAMFGPSLAQLIGATTLLSAADRLPPRATMTTSCLAFGLGTAALALPGLPVWAHFAIVMTLGLVASLGGGVSYGLLNEILPQGSYLLGRSVLNMSVGAMQICGFAVGGVLVAVLSPRGTLLAGAAMYLAAAAVARFGLSRRPRGPPGRRRSAQPGGTTHGCGLPHRAVMSISRCGCPMGSSSAASPSSWPMRPSHAGLLFTFAALGMLAGDTLAGRFVPQRWREWLGAPLRLLLAAPYLIFALHPALPLAAAAVALASVGYSASLLLQQRLMILTPDELSGHALGLHSSGMLAMQGVGAAFAGVIAQLTSPATAMALMAAISITVTLALAPGLAARPQTAATR